MMKRKKLKLENLKVISFLTSEESRNVRGMTELNTNCVDTDCQSINPMNDCWDTALDCDPTNSCVTCNNTCANTCLTCSCGCGTTTNAYTTDPTLDCDDNTC